jgi:integrase
VLIVIPRLCHDFAYSVPIQGPSAVARENFTIQRIEAYKHTRGEGTKQRETLYWDAGAQALGLRVTASGAKAYIFESRLFGKTIRVTIGSAGRQGAWTLDAARREARRLQTLVDAGRDPREVKAEQRAEHDARQAAARRKEASVSEAWRSYLEANRDSWSERHYIDHINLARTGGEEKKRGKGKTSPGPLAPLLTLRMADLTADRVSTWLVDEAQARPTNAEQSYRKLRAFIRWCEDRPEYAGLVPAGAYSGRSVRDVVPKPKAKDDCLQREQLSVWFAAVRQLANPVISTYLQGLLLTGARRGELAALRWEDVDFQWGSLTIRDKVEGERTVPLTPYLASLLSGLPRRNEWVFSSPTAADGKLGEPRPSHNKALGVAGLPHVSIHGLRRSFGTLCEWVEMPAGISAQIMGHKPSALAEKHYRRRPLDLLRMWHTKIEVWMLEQAGIKFEAKLVQSGLRVVGA